MTPTHNSLLYLVAGVALGSLGLWLMIGQFLGSTTDMAASLASRTAQDLSRPAHAQSPLSPEQDRHPAVSGQGTALERTAANVSTQESAGKSASATASASASAAASWNESGNQTATVSATAPERDAADRSERAASVQSGTTTSPAEPAENDDDIVARKSIEQLENQTAGNGGLQIAEMSETLPDLASVEAEDDPLIAVQKPIKPGPELAADVSLDVAAHCRGRAADVSRVGVYFRPGSFAIKGSSLGELDTIIKAARRCQPSIVVVQSHLPAQVDGDEDRARDMAERRADEIKYYLLQRGISRNLMRFQDRS